MSNLISEQPRFRKDILLLLLYIISSVNDILLPKLESVNVALNTLPVHLMKNT